MNNLDNMTPKKIGNFNIPKNVIECKIDTLAFLELLLRKNICTWEEVEEVREAVVMHLNVIFPELQLSYTTPQPLRDQAPITPPEQPQKPLYYTANPTDIENVSAPTPEIRTENPAQSSPQNRPLFHTAVPKVMGGSANVKQGVSPIRPINQNYPSANPAPKAPENTPTVENNPKPQNENTENVEATSVNQELENTNSTPPITQPVSSVNNPTPQAQQQVKPMQKTPFPTSGPPKILNNPPRRKI